MGAFSLAGTLLQIAEMPMPQRVGAHRRQAGFSMIEVLVSAVVTGVVAVSAFYFLSSQGTAGVKGSDLMKGVNLGKLKMDSLKVVAYGDLSSGSDTVSERYIRSWHVGVVRDGAGNPNGRKSIELMVYWPLTGEQMVSFTSIKSDDKFRDGEDE